MTSLFTSSRKLWALVKMVESDASDGFRSNFSIRALSKITKFHIVVGNNWPHAPVGYDITSCFWSTAQCNKILYESGAYNGSGRQKSQIIRPPFNPDLPNVAWTSRPTYSTATLDITSSATSVRLIGVRKNSRKYAASDGSQIEHQMMCVASHFTQLDSW